MPAKRPESASQHRAALAGAGAGAGAGIAACTLATVKADLRDGRLIRVLPQYTLGDRHYHALYPHARYLPGKVRAFVDFMVEHYAGMRA